MRFRLHHLCSSLLKLVCAKEIIFVSLTAQFNFKHSFDFERAFYVK